jgi:RND family efflux transporter MFP subunit
MIGAPYPTPGCARRENPVMTAPQHDLSKLRIDRDAPSPELRRAVTRNVVIAAVAVVLVVATLLFFRRGAAAEVRTTVVAATSSAGGGAGAGVASVTATGYVVARTRASVSSKVAGRLAVLTASEGTLLRRGELIARLENADFQAQVAQAEANLATARATLAEARATQVQQERDARRLRAIRATNAALMAEADVDAAESRATIAVAKTESAESGVRAAEAGLRFARVNLANTEIRAPFTGTVLRKEAEVGEVVAPSVGGGLTRGAVVTMADLTTLEVEVDVNEAYIARIRRDQPARLTLDAYPDTSFRAHVRQVVPTADRQRATVQVKVAIDDRDPRILPEMGARVDFLEPDASRKEGAVPAAPRIRVPAEAVREQGGQSVVWVVRDQRLESRPVQAGPASGGFREIRSGLSGGEQLLLSGVEAPTAGMRVKVSNP